MKGMIRIWLVMMPVTKEVNEGEVARLRRVTRISENLNPRILIAKIDEAYRDLYQYDCTDQENKKLYSSRRHLQSYTSALSSNIEMDLN